MNFENIEGLFMVTLLIKMIIYDDINDFFKLVGYKMSSRKLLK